MVRTWILEFAATELPFKLSFSKVNSSSLFFEFISPRLRVSFMAFRLTMPTLADVKSLFRVSLSTRNLLNWVLNYLER